MCNSEPDARKHGSVAIGVAGVGMLAAGGMLGVLGPAAVLNAAVSTLGSGAVAVLLSTTVLVAAFGPARRGAWWLITHAVWPALVFGGFTAGLWLAGKPFTPRSTDRRKLSAATWLRPGAKVIEVTRTGAHWYAWAGWQRTLVRSVGVLFVIAAFVAPIVTACLAGSVGVLAAARLIAVRVAARRSNDRIRRVRAVVGRPNRALAGSADAVDGELITPVGVHA